LLDLSRIASGKMRIDLRDVNLGHIITLAVEGVRPAATAKRVVIVNDADATVPTVAGDAGRLQQVFWNLLMNAIKFTPAGGRIDVMTRVDGPNLQVIIRDTGEGIAADVLPHVFERFRQGDSSTTRVHGGLGLGLALVQHFVEMHGGSVDAASRGRDKGATFTISLPVRISLLQQTSATARQDAAARRRR
jgi:signal transduction histidine kinase